MFKIGDKVLVTTGKNDSTRQMRGAITHINIAAQFATCECVTGVRSNGQEIKITIPFRFDEIELA